MLAGMRELYQHPDATGFDINAAIRLAVDTSEQTRQETYSRYLAKYQALLPTGESALYKGLTPEVNTTQNFPKPPGGKAPKRTGGHPYWKKRAQKQNSTKPKFGGQMNQRRNKRGRVHTLARAIAAEMRQEQGQYNNQ